MHECPSCGMVCDCDGEDLWNDAAAGQCDCACDEFEDHDECPICGGYDCDCGEEEVGP